MSSALNSDLNDDESWIDAGYIFSEFYYLKILLKLSCYKAKLFHTKTLPPLYSHLKSEDYFSNKENHPNIFLGFFSRYENTS